MDEQKVSERVRVTCPACGGPFRIYGPSFCPVCREQRAVMATLLSPRITPLEEAKLALGEAAEAVGVLCRSVYANNAEEWQAYLAAGKVLTEALAAVRAEREKKE